jgi:RNA polymerase sigma-70 factor (ECF subfamily)
MAQVDGDDRALALRLVEGDAAAFELLYRRHNAAMIRLCNGIIRSRVIAEDVAQDTWVTVLDRIDLFEGRGSLASWIYTILINKARSRARREGRTVSFDDFGVDGTLNDAFDGRGHWRTMPALWENLTPERHVEGRSGQQELDPAEVCTLLDISEGNMRVLLHRARLTVRNALDRLNADL